MAGLYKITFYLDGKGVAYDPIEPIHFDSLVYYFAAIRHEPGEPPTRTDHIDPAEELGISIFKSKLNGYEVFRASAIFPEDENIMHDLRHIRKRFRMDRADLCAARIINQSSHFFKSENIPHNIMLCDRMVAWFYGSRRKVKKELKDLKAIGAGRRFGFGRVLSFEIEEADEDHCLEWEGRAMRFYPHPGGIKEVRPRPPYWNITDKTPCLLPGDEIPGVE